MSGKQASNRQKKSSQMEVVCPYVYEITDDGRLIIEGEDVGDAKEFLDAGEKLRDLLFLWREVSGSNTTQML